MNPDLSWADRGVKGAQDSFQRNRHSKTPSFLDGTNVRAKSCECERSTVFDSNEDRCQHCGREPKDERRYRL